MPIFEYVCTKCEHRFEALIFGSQKAACPKCHSKHLAPQLSVFGCPVEAPDHLRNLRCPPAAADHAETRAGRALAPCPISIESKLIRRFGTPKVVPKHRHVSH